MLASFPASMLNQKPSDLGILNRFKLDPSRSRHTPRCGRLPCQGPCLGSIRAGNLLSQSQLRLMLADLEIRSLQASGWAGYASIAAEVKWSSAKNPDFRAGLINGSARCVFRGIVSTDFSAS